MAMPRHIFKQIHRLWNKLSSQFLPYLPGCSLYYFQDTFTNLLLWCFKEQDLISRFCSLMELLFRTSQCYFSGIKVQITIQTSAILQCLFKSWSLLSSADLDKSSCAMEVVCMVLSAFSVLKIHHCNLIDVTVFTSFSLLYPLVLIPTFLNIATATVLCCFGDYKKK